MKALLLCLLLSGCATADYAQWADIGTTALAFEQGFIEANPVISGLPIAGIAAVKVGMTQAFKVAPKEYCEPGLFLLTLAGTGAALWNIALICGAAPAAIPIIAAIWMVEWDRWQQAAIEDCRNNFFEECVMKTLLAAALLFPLNALAGGTCPGPAPCEPVGPSQLCIAGVCVPVSYAWLGRFALASSMVDGYAVMGWAGPCNQTLMSQCPDIRNQAFGDLTNNALRAYRARRQ